MNFLLVSGMMNDPYPMIEHPEAVAAVAAVAPVAPVAPVGLFGLFGFMQANHPTFALVTAAFRAYHIMTAICYSERLDMHEASMVLLPVSMGVSYLKFLDENTLMSSVCVTISGVALSILLVKSEMSSLTINTGLSLLGCAAIYGKPRAPIGHILNLTALIEVVYHVCLETR